MGSIPSSWRKVIVIGTLAGIALCWPFSKFIHAIVAPGPGEVEAVVEDSKIGTCYSEDTTRLITNLTLKQAKILEKLKIKYGEQLRLDWDLRTGLLSRLYIPTQSFEIIDKAVQNIAMDLLTEWKDLLGIDPLNLRAPRMRISTTNTDLKYSQLCQGVPVIGKCVQVTLQTSGGGVSIISNYDPEIHIPTTPQYTVQAAVKIVAALEEARGRHNLPPPTTRLVIHPGCGRRPDDSFSDHCNYVLAWELDYGAWGFYVSALTGDVIFIFGPPMF